MKRWRDGILVPTTHLAGTPEVSSFPAGLKEVLRWPPAVLLMPQRAGGREWAGRDSMISLKAPCFRPIIVVFLLQSYVPLGIGIISEVYGHDSLELFWQKVD